MDLNQLLYHHQMALIAANRAHRDGRPHANFDLPRYYAKRIGEYRARRGLGVGPALMADRDDGPRADPPTSAQGDDYPVFLGDTLVAELLVNKALAMTEAVLRQLGATPEQVDRESDRVRGELFAAH